MLKEGDTAPPFTLKDQDGKPVSLSDFAGRKVIVYFYPKDNTPGCTKEACSFRDNYEAIQEKGAVVIGISPDSSVSHEKFRSRFGLPFHLVSDPEKIALKAFGAWGKKKLYGKTYEGVIRSTFVVDEKGTIIKAWPKVKPVDHALQVLDVL
jgi:peroxiredoxin Q/BCP